MLLCLATNVAFTRLSGERRGWDIWLKGHRCQPCRPDTHAFRYCC